MANMSMRTSPGSQPELHLVTNCQVFHALLITILLEKCIVSQVPLTGYLRKEKKCINVISNYIFSTTGKPESHYLTATYSKFKIPSTRLKPEQRKANTRLKLQ
jgi:hypothetical protein